MRLQRNLSEAQKVDISMQRHVNSFVHMVTDGGKSYTAAWEVIKSRSYLGDKLMFKLSEMCVAAATEAKAA